LQPETPVEQGKLLNGPRNFIPLAQTLEPQVSEDLDTPGTVAFALRVSHRSPAAQ